MTEDEAKQKWCPFARQMAGIVTADGSGSGPTDYDATPVPVFNRVEGPGKSALWPAGTRCIGSACMAWRTAEITRKIDGGGYTISTYKTRTVSFCGLAGVPQ